jgi:hypothetical protein
MTKPNLRSDDFDEFCDAWKLADQAERAAYAQLLDEIPAEQRTELDELKLETMRMMTTDYGAEDDDVDPDGPPAPVEATPFPVAALPEWAQPFVIELARQNQTPVDLPALVAIGAMSAVATQHRSTLKVVGTWVEGPNLYIAVAMPPGAGKSPVMNALIAPVEEAERRNIADKADTRRTLAAQMVTLEKKVKDLTKDLESTDDPGPRLIEDWKDATQELEDARASIDDGRMLADDTTPEALIALLARNGHTISLISTEGGMFDSLGRYVERGTPPNLDGLLKIWSGDTVKVDRKSGEPIQLTNPRATVCLTVQPSVVAKVLGNNEFVGRGLVARFMLAQPESYVGRRDMMAVAEVDEAAAKQWHNGIMALYSAGQRHMTLDGLALTAFLGFRSHLEERRFIGGDLEAPTLVEFSTKCESSVARLALIFALADDADHVSMDHMTRAIRVGHYWVSQMLGLCGDYTASSLDQRTARFVTWAHQKHPDGGRIKVRDVQTSSMFKRSGYDDKDSIIEVFERAEQLGHGSIDWSSERSVVFVVPKDTRNDEERRAHYRAQHGRQPFTQSDTDHPNTTESPPRDVQLYTHKGISDTSSSSIPHSLMDERTTRTTDDTPEPDPDEWDTYEWPDE